MLLTLAVQVENLCQSSRCQTVPKAAVARQTVATKGASSGRSRKPQKSTSATKKRERHGAGALVELRTSKTVLLAAAANLQGIESACGHRPESLRIIPLI